MALAEQISEDMKNAMKAKETATLSTLRLLRSALKNKQIDLGRELSDEDIHAVIKTQIKQLNDSLESFKSAGRDESVKAIESEIIVLEKYLPAQMSDDELERLVKEAIVSVGAQSKSDMGKAMGAAMKAVEGRADGNRVKEKIAQLLG